MQVILKKRISTRFFDVEKGIIYNAKKESDRYLLELGDSLFVMVDAKHIEEIK